MITLGQTPQSIWGQQAPCLHASTILDHLTWFLRVFEESLIIIYLGESSSDDMELVVCDDLPESETFTRSVNQLLQVLKRFLLVERRLG